MVNRGRLCEEKGNRKSFLFRRRKLFFSSADWPVDVVPNHLTVQIMSH